MHNLADSIGLSAYFFVVAGSKERETVNFYSGKLIL
jgi:hypothetical protein